MTQALITPSNDIIPDYQSWMTDCPAEQLRVATVQEFMSRADSDAWWGIEGDALKIGEEIRCADGFILIDEDGNFVPKKAIAASV